MLLSKKKALVSTGTLMVALGIVLSTYAQTSDKELEPPAPLKEIKYHTGFIPPAEILPHLGRKPRPDLVQAADLPAKWDWREQGCVTPVKNQGGCGSCYAFAAIGSFESAIMVRWGLAYDLSENNVKECIWGDPSCGGGSSASVAGYLAGSGSVLEADDPYVDADVECADSVVYQHALLDWRIVSGGIGPDPFILKQYIYEYGPVESSLCAGDPGVPDWRNEFTNYDGSYTLYFPTDDCFLNHAVLIVGWDDNLEHAGGTGGWIVKNSWGTDWGGPCGYGYRGGYFTIAYGSAKMGSHTYFVQDWKELDPNEKVFLYDEAYPMGGCGFDDVTAWGMCAFEHTRACSLFRVEFWTLDVTTDIDIYIYDDFDGTTLSNLLTSKLDAAYTEAGYHSVALDSLLRIEAGDDFYVALKVTDESYVHPFRLDQQGPIEIGKTFISPNAEPGTWIDMGDDPPDRSPGDVAIRVRAIVDQTPPEPPPPPEPVPSYYSLSYAYPNPFNSHTTIPYSLENPARVDLSVYNLLGQKVKTLVSGSKPAGEHVINWDGTDDNGESVASGVYLYQLETNEYVDSKKLILLK
ncbi:MAG: T9SS type A sorting domain-containing protein [Candidatus Zixiibacteriota bacterium]|nr:MAG: T9SS type A sorting domain-containing protein [candidate division Zixibacteria bacterium]